MAATKKEIKEQAILCESLCGKLSRELTNESIAPTTAREYIKVLRRELQQLANMTWAW